MKASKRVIFNLINIIAAILMVFTVIRGAVIANDQIRTNHNVFEHSTNAGILTGLNDDWTLCHADGRVEVVSLPYTLAEDEDEVVVSKNVEGLFDDGDIIKFDNNRQTVVVTLDDEVIYEVNTTSLKKQLIFTDYILAGLPDAANASQLSLRIAHATANEVVIPDISYGPYESARNEIVVNDILTFIILSILAIELLVLIGVFIFCIRKKIEYDQVFDLLIFIFTAILWGISDSYLPVLVDIPQEVVGLICYLSIMALSLPMSHFVWVSCKRRNESLRIILGIGALNLALQSVLSIFGVIQLQKTFIFAHVLIIAVIIAAMINTYNMRKEMIKEDKLTTDVSILFSGIVILAIVGVASLLLYWQKGGLYYRNCMLIGVLIFSAILCASVVVHYLSEFHTDQLKLSESKIHERLSFYDELTGLPNRRAFEKKLAEVEKSIDSIEDAVLIMLDVNGLKMVNDQYGHTAGDDLIVSASRVIEMTYGQRGSCFRIGGDEFVVILLDLTIPMSTYDAIFDENIANINKTSRWKLSIAKGTSNLAHPNGQKLNISDWKQEADVNMYRTKLLMSGNKSRDRAKDFQDIINCVISTVEAKDAYTAAHSERVRELAYCIAKNLGVSDHTVWNLEIAAQLHDIGKIGVPDVILFKNGRLLDDEYEKLKRHSQLGAGVIGRAKGMQEIADIVLHHHERWDGKGYPAGLSKEDIPIESRIIAIADSIDAMTSKRVYRDRLSVDDCRNEIEKNSGIMYDPAITSIVLQHWDEIVDIIMLHPKRLIGVTE